MILGMTLQSFTVLHTAISLIGIASGLSVVMGMVGGRERPKWTALFLLTTVLTSVTGFMFPFDHLLPSHKVGMLSLVALAIAILGRYPMHLAGGWRRTYVLSAVLSLYLNVFVLLVQLFLKVPALKALAPTQQEPPFFVSQLIVLAVFIGIAIKAVKGFREDRGRAMGRAA